MQDTSTLYKRIDELQRRARVTEKALVELTDLHHRTLTNSRLHNPQSQEWFNCTCLTCLKTASLLPNIVEELRELSDV